MSIACYTDPRSRVVLEDMKLCALTQIQTILVGMSHVVENSMVGILRRRLSKLQEYFRDILRARVCLHVQFQVSGRFWLSYFCLVVVA